MSRENYLETSGTYRAMPYWVVVSPTMGYRCGYVGIPDCIHTKWNELATIEEDGEELAGTDHIYEAGINCHGGVTFETQMKGDADWYECFEGMMIGFDCAHAWDGTDPELLSDNGLELGHRMKGEVRTKDFCIAECESIIDQLWSGPSGDEMKGVLTELEYQLKKENI